MGDLTRVDTSLPVQLVDANDSQVADITTATPSGTESGLIVRNIPSGTQTVNGTVVSTPTGTYTIVGTTTLVPSGTQAVSGTVNANPTGTYTVSGTTTNIPSGTQVVSGSVSANPAGIYTIAPSGTQTVAPSSDWFTNSYTVIPSSDWFSSTYSVTGNISVSNFPATQVVMGTVNANPNGVYTVAGTTTSVPSGTQTVIGSGTAGTASSGVVTVQGIANGVAQNVSIVEDSSKSKGSNNFTRVQPTTTATQILATNSNRKAVLIYNAGSVIVYLGDSNTVSSTTGVPLLPDSALEDEVSLDAWWGIAASGTGDLRVIETTI